MNREPNPDRRAPLIDRLVDLRDEMLGRMLRRCAVEPGHLPLIAGINAALDALDAMAIETKPAVRAAVSDDGRQIRLVLYDGMSAVATVVLGGWCAVRLAGRLLDAAGSKLVP